MSNKQQADARKLLNVLRAVKSRQDDTAQPNRGRGLWLTAKLWQALSRHLEQQASDVEALQQALYEKEEEAEQLRQQLDDERAERQRVIEDMQAQEVQLRKQAEFPLAELGVLRSQMRNRQEAWDKQKYELEGQLDRLMGVLRNMGLLADSEGQRQASAPSPSGVQGFESGGPGLVAPEVQALQVRELSMLLADARHQVESYRRQLAMRSVPAEEMAIEIKRLKADNQRLVALLARVPEYRAMAAELAADSGVHYIPLEETLMVKGLVADLHPPLLDRPVEDVAGQALPGAGRKRDPDGPDPSLTLVLDEQYHWVPRKALETGAALMRRMMPALPMSQLLVLVGELNKVWRDREKQRLAEVAEAHREELRRLQHVFQQRAPYEAVVAGQKINDLKRRMRAQAAQAAAAAAAAHADQRRVQEDSKVMLHAGLSSIQDLSRQVARLVAKNKKLASKGGSRRRTGPAQPLCSACLDRLLMPPTLGQLRPGAADADLQQEQQTSALGATAAPFPERQAGAAAAAAAGAPHSRAHAPEGPHAYDGPYHDTQYDGGNWDDECGSGQAYHGTAGSPRGLLAADVPTFNLTSHSGTDPAAAAATAEPYSGGTVVRVNLATPPRHPPPQRHPPLAAPNPGWVRDEAAVARPPPLRLPSAAASAGLASGPTDAVSRGTTLKDLATLPGWHLGPTSPGSRQGAEAHKTVAASGQPHAHGGAVEVGGEGGVARADSGSGAPAIATVELSTASLADWGAGASAPITVRVQVAGASPARPAAAPSGGVAPLTSARGGTGYGSDTGSEEPAQPQLQTRVQAQQRGVPVRVRVRFPRQDVVQVLEGA